MNLVRINLFCLLEIILYILLAYSQLCKPSLATIDITSPASTTKSAQKNAKNESFPKWGIAVIVVVVVVTIVIVGCLCFQKRRINLTVEADRIRKIVAHRKVVQPETEKIIIRIIQQQQQ